MSAQVAQDLRAGDVVRYTPESTWCHDGIAIAKEQYGHLVLLDTYWVGGGSDSVVRPETYEVLFNLGDYDSKPQYEWEKYAPADRQFIGKQKGYYPLFLVKKGATPDLATQVENARGRVTEAVEKFADAQHHLDFMRRELAALEAAADAAEAQP